MNRIFSVIWNHSLSAWVVASEHASRHGKRTSIGAVQTPEHKGPLRALAMAIALTLAPVGAFAADLPTGGHVVLGSGQILTPDQQQMIINQSSNKLAIDWQSFNIGADKKVTFVQPGKDSVALNRVVGTDGSKIMGQLNANGQVFLVNPNGVLFGKGSSVDVGGLVASTLDISNRDFAAGNYKFEGNGSNASVVNQGTIKVAEGGAVALLGGTVSNQGVIAAKLGTVALAAGNKVTLDFAGDGLLNVQVDEATKNALVENKQLIQASGGQVIMTAKASDALLQTVVNNTGVIEAQTLGEKGGKIVLLGGFDGGTVQVAGTLDASAPVAGNGGFIETSGAHVKVADSARVTTAAAKGKTGKWLIDPVDFTIAASGGDMTGAAVTKALKTNDLEVMSTQGLTGTQGNVNVNDTVVWSANTLTLTAQNNVNINKEMFGSGTARLAVNYGQGAVAAGNTSRVNVKAPVNLSAGQHYSTRQGSNGTQIDYTVITSLGAMGSVTGLDLQGINGALSGNFVLGANINAGATLAWNGGAGFDSLGTFAGGGYSGIFDGLGHTISNLQISHVETDSGLFAAVGTRGVVRNVGLVGGAVNLVGDTDGDFPAYFNVGALVGHNLGLVENSYASTAVSASNGAQLGGLVGTNAGTIRNSSFSGTVTDKDYAGAGGLVWLNTASGQIINSYSTGDVIGLKATTLAGLVLWNEGAISGSSASGSVTSTENSEHNGGLVGWNKATGTITNSYATGNVIGGGGAGGLVGENEAGGQVTNSYATGNVGINGTGAGTYSGGLVGTNAGSLTNVYSTGSVTGSLSYPSNNGGLVGLNGGSIANAYATGIVTGGESGGLIGRHSGGSLVNGYYNISANPGLSGQGNGLSSGSVGAGSAVGLSFAQMKSAGSFGGFNFSSAPGQAGNAWVIVSADGASSLPMLASEYSTTLTNAHQLQLVAMDMSADYTLGRDIDASATAGTSNVWDSSFIALGGTSGTFSGSLDGNGHVIKGLTINRPNNAFTGLFTNVWTTGRISNLGLEGGSITGREFTGALAGFSMGSMTDVFSTAAVSGTYGVGGVVGRLSGGTLSNAYASGSVAGQMFYVGGLVGYMDNGVLSNSFASGRVTNARPNGMGALVGDGDFTTLAGNFWDVAATGQTYSSGNLGTRSTVGGLSSAQVLSQSAFAAAGWDLKNTWVVYDGVSGPLLRSFMTQLTYIADSASKTYDGLAYNGSYSGSSAGDSRVTGSLGFVGAGQSAIDAGTYALQLGGLASTGGQYGYSINYIDGTLDVAKAVLSQTGMTVSSKAYDGTTLATVGNGTLIGLVNRDVGQVAVTGTYASKNVGTGIQVDLGLSGASAGNYIFDSGSPLSADITAKALTLTDLVAHNKVYDGNANAVVSGGILNGLVAGEQLTLTTSGQFSTQNAVNRQTVQVNATLSDGTGLASNYSLSPLAISPVTASIQQKSVSITGLTANKVYDGNTFVTFTGAVLNGLVGTDDVVMRFTGDFADKNAGTGKIASMGPVYFTSSNVPTSNYIYFIPQTIIGTIAKAAISGVSGMTAYNKVYDGNARVSLSADAATINGLIAGDNVFLAGANGQFSDKNAGNDKTVMISNITLSGSDLGNYTFTNNAATATASITPKTLTLTGVTAADKVYDGNRSVQLAGGLLSGLVSGETLSYAWSGQFDDSNAGAGKTVTLGSSLFDGTGLASNYSVVNPTNVTANITPKALTVTGVTANGKVYDGTTVATLNGGTLDGLVGSETLTLGGLAGEFDNKNVGTGKTVSISGASLLDGTGLASNYSVSNPSSVTAAITTKALTLTGVSASGKVYDGNTAATLSGGTLNGLVGGETLAVTGLTGAFADKNVGTGKTVSINGASLVDGTGLASNYSLGNPADVSASIIAKALTVNGITADNKVYDATTGATLNLADASFSGLVSGDDLSVLSANGAFSDKNAGTGKTVAISAITLGGSDAGNYLWGTSSTTADIGKAALNVGVANSQKLLGQGNPQFVATYQGLLGADTTGQELSGNLAFSTTATATSDRGQYSVSASGLSSSNYAIAYTDGVLTVDTPPASTVAEQVQPLRNLPQMPVTAPRSAPQLPSDLYTLVEQGLRLPEGL